MRLHEYAAAVAAVATLGTAAACSSSTSRPGCTACDGQCTDQGRCVTTIATDPFGPAAIVTDGQALYWANGGDGTIAWVPTQGLSSSPTLLVSGEDDPRGIAVDASNVYWMNRAGAVRAAPVHPSSPGPSGATTLATIDVGPLGLPPIGVAVTSFTDVFVVRTDGTIAQPGSVVMSIPRGGGAAVTVARAPGMPVALALDTQQVYWATALVDPHTSLAVGGTILAAPVGGGGPIVLANDLCGTFCAMALDAGHLYWVVGDAIRAVPLSGGPATTLATVAASPVALAADGDAVYAIDAAGVLSKIPASGGEATVLAKLDGAGSLAVDATNVYGTVLSSPFGSTGNVVQVTPK